MLTSAAVVAVVVVVTEIIESESDLADEFHFATKLIDWSRGELLLVLIQKITIVAIVASKILKVLSNHSIYWLSLKLVLYKY